MDLSRINVELFRQQRESLRFVIDEGHYRGDVIQEHLEGLESLLDELYDELLPPEAACTVEGCTNTDIESTYCGSYCGEHLSEHVTECEVCAKDFG